MNIIVLSTVFFIVLAIIFYLYTKKISKAIGYAILIYTAIQIILGFFLYLDAMQLKDKFPIEEKTMLLEHNNKYIAGFKGKKLDNQNDVTFFNANQINSYQGQNYQEALRNSYKLIVVKSRIFNKIETVEFSEQIFTIQELFSILESDNSIDEITNRFFEEQRAEQLSQYSEYMWPQIEEQLKEQKSELVNQFKNQLDIEDDNQLKGLIFALLLSQIMKEDPLMMVKGIQKNDIIIYPETSTFIFIKLVPDYLIKVIQDKFPQFIK